MIQIDLPIQDWRLDLVLINKKKRIYYLEDFAMTPDHKLKEKDGEKLDKHLDLARKWNKVWNMKVTVIPIVVGTLGTVSKNMEKRLDEWEIRRRIKTIQTTKIG